MQFNDVRVMHHGLQTPCLSQSNVETALVQQERLQRLPSPRRRAITASPAGAATGSGVAGKTLAVQVGSHLSVSTETPASLLQTTRAPQTGSAGHPESSVL